MNDDELLPSNNPVAQKRSSKTNFSSSNEILKAYQVDAYRYVNKKYESRGKVGLALLVSKINNSFNLLIYGKGNAHITQANVNSEFAITSTEELYVSFYDIKSENWSLRFDSLELFNEFLSRMCIYKMMSSNKADLVVIDLKSGNGAKVQETDLCEIDLTINSIKNNDISSTIYSSDNQESLRTQVGSNKLMMAIEKSLVGMSKGGYRVIGVPFKSPYIKGGSITIPIETNILIYIKLIRTKSKVEKPQLKPDITAADSELPLPDLNFDQQYKSDVEFADKSKKSDLLTRMAMLGKPIPAYNAETSNTDVLTKNISHNAYVPVTTHETNVSHPYNYFDAAGLNKQLLPVHSINPPFNSAQQLYPQVQNLPVHSLNPPFNSVQQIYSQVPNQPASSDFSVLFTETRQNNTEMRVAMSKLQDKIDKILDKIDMKTSDTQKSLTRHMDAEHVFENIKRIVDENESLKQENHHKSEIIEKQNKRINEMLKNNQFILNESYDVIQRNSSTFNSSATEQQNRVLQLEEEKLNFIRNLSQKTAEVSQLEQKLEEASTNAHSYRVKSLEYNEQITKLSDEIGNLKLNNRSLQTELSDLKIVHNSNAKIQDELQTQQKQWLEEETALQKKIELFKAKAIQLNSKLNEIQSNCEAEISEARQQCHQEVEEWKNKLKSERQRINSKNSNLLTEIDQINQEWEQKFEDYRQNESVKLTKITERNRELMVENANTSRELLQLKQQVAMAGDVKYSLETELTTKNQALSQELNEMQKKLFELTELKLKNGYLEAELGKLREDNIKSKETNFNGEMYKNRNEELELKLAELRKERDDLLSVKSVNATSDSSSVLNVEMKIKKIMNDVFKEIKNDFNLDSNYSGKEVVNICMTIIRDMTLVHLSGDNAGKNDEESDESDDESSASADKDVDEIEVDHTIDQAIVEVSSKDKSQTEQTDDDIVPTVSENTPLELNSDLVETESKLADDKSDLNETDDISQNSFDNKNEVIISSLFQHENHNLIKSEQLENEPSGHVSLDLHDENETKRESFDNDDVNQIPLYLKDDNQTKSESTENEESNQIPLYLEHEDQIKSEYVDNELTNQIPLDMESSNQFESYVLVNEPINFNIGNDELNKSESSEKEDTVSTQPIKTDELVNVPDNTIELESNLLKDTAKDSKKESILSSDEDDVSEFFEKLTKKTKPRDSQTKIDKPNIVSLDNDDLSWLND